MILACRVPPCMMRCVQLPDVVQGGRSCPGSKRPLREASFYVSVRNGRPIKAAFSLIALVSSPVTRLTASINACIAMPKGSSCQKPPDRMKLSREMSLTSKPGKLHEAWG